MDDDAAQRAEALLFVVKALLFDMAQEGGTNGRVAGLVRDDALLAARQAGTPPAMALALRDIVSGVPSPRLDGS